MKIDILCNDGSPLGVSSKDLWGQGERGIGVGGSEYGLLTMCEEWKKAGHRVRLYNDPINPRDTEFAQLAIGSFQSHEDRDILIVFRSPNDKAIVAKGLKVWWSCDQYTIGNFADFAPTMDKIVCISDFHVEYFKEQYGIIHATKIDLPVRVHDLHPNSIEKRPNSLIFTSVPDRGLTFMREAWNTIKKKVPEASLTITSDYRLWGLDEPRNDKYRTQWVGAEDVTFWGAIPRSQLIEEQLAADLYTYPCIYDELFCVSAAEAQCCGAYPITSSVGALETTNMGKIITAHPTDNRTVFMRGFVEAIEKALRDDDLKKKQEEIRKKAVARFHPDNILKQWENKIFNE
jgi:glycosyltransferase involved in cell wall biosynthesis